MFEAMPAGVTPQRQGDPRSPWSRHLPGMRAATLALTLAAGCRTDISRSESTRRTDASANPAKPLVVAAYYIWYRDGDDPALPYDGWTRPNQLDRPAAPQPPQPKPGEPPIAATAYPLAGLYDSRDPDVADWHVRLAQAAGIDAFLVSWWGTHKGLDEAWEKGILAAAERRGFKIALFDERAQFHEDFAWYKESLSAALARFKDSPAYLHRDGKPVVYLYQTPSNATLTPAKFSELKAYVEERHGPIYWIVDKLAHNHRAATAGDTDREKVIPAPWLETDGVDCFAFYSTFSHFRAWTYDDLAGRYRYLAGLAHKAGKDMLLPVHPGHDNARFRTDPFVMPRRNGQTLRDYLRAAEEAQADIIMITSWNEWPETIVVEPASTWDDPYHYLRILADWKGITFTAPTQ